MPKNRRLVIAAATAFFTTFIFILIQATGSRPESSSTNWPATTAFAAALSDEPEPRVMEDPDFVRRAMREQPPPQQNAARSATRPKSTARRATVAGVQLPQFHKVYEAAFPARLTTPMSKLEPWSMHPSRKSFADSLSPDEYEAYAQAFADYVRNAVLEIADRSPDPLDVKAVLKDLETLVGQAALNP
ncbi:MAG: hypothetical protein ACKVX7_09160 [Planctomycetota bacterium]